jgi:hypothetical protein
MSRYDALVTETATTHEARARNAKAQALAAVLHAHGATVANVTALPPAGWSMVAELASIETGRKVHAPNSQATIDAVARILGLLIAAESDAAAVAEAWPTFVAPAPTPAQAFDDDPEPWLDDDDSAEYRSRKVADMTQADWDALAEGDEAYVPPERRPTDSQGYRSTLRELDPVTARTFAAFGQAVR